MALEVFLHPLSSYCQKVKTALYENDTPFETKMLDGSEPVASEFAGLWPIGRFPIIVDDGHMLAEASIIIEYLDVHYPGTTRFIPSDPDLALEVRLMDRLFDNYVNTPQQRLVDVALGRDKTEEAPLRHAMEQAYGLLEQRLQGRLWAAGDNFSLADCGAAPSLLYADWTHPIGKQFTNVRSYRARLLARPSYARALDEARPYRQFFPLGAPLDRD